MKINRLKITNFKSIDSLTLSHITNFSVFAGANGSGKTTIFQALDFVGHIFRQGLSQTLREFGGYDNVHSHKRRAANTAIFSFDIEVEIKQVIFHYALKAELNSNVRIIHEVASIDGEVVLQRGKDGFITFEDGKKIAFDPDRSATLFPGIYDTSFKDFISNIKVLRVDPLNAKQPNLSDHDPSELNEHASNIAAVLSRILSENSDLSEEILELITLLVPNLEKIEAQAQKIDNKTGLLFKEKGTRKQFPAHLISDGTIYALAQIIMILDRKPNSWLLIEEPERGIHPQAIQELVELMREESQNTIIWNNTHSESIVRTARYDELLLVDKVDGKTLITHAKKINGSLSMSDAWLSNMFKGGLPW